MRTPQAKLARSGAAVIVCLDALRDAVRTRWDSIAVATSGNLEKLFRLKLGSSDVFLQIDKTNWLVVMPGSRMEDALVCCMRIAHQLHISVIPACDLTQLKVSPAMAIADDMLDLAPLTPQQQRAVAKRAGLDELLSPKKDGAAVTALPVAPNGKHRFEAMWDSKRHIIAGYRCLPDASAGPGDSIGVQLRHTQTMLNDMVTILEQGLLHHVRSIVFAPIPYDVLSAPPARMELLSTLRQMKCELRPFLVFEIATLAAGIPKHRLIEIVSAVQPFARAVIARTGPRNPSLLDYGGAGLKALGFDLGNSPTEPADITGISVAAKRLGMVSYLGNMASGRLLEHAVAQGVQWVSGPAVGRPVNEPAAPSRLTLETILQAWDQPIQVNAAG